MEIHRNAIQCGYTPEAHKDTRQKFSILEENHTNRTCLIEVTSEGYTLQKEWVCMHDAVKIRNDVRRANLD